MDSREFYEELTKRFGELIREHDLLNEKVEIRGRILKPGEAIGSPKGGTSLC